MDGMECRHPYWEGKGAYTNMIITQNNSKSRVPEECPLRHMDGAVTVQLSKSYKDSSP